MYYILYVTGLWTHQIHLHILNEKVGIGLYVLVSYPVALASFSLISNSLTNLADFLYLGSIS